MLVIVALIVGYLCVRKMRHDHGLLESPWTVFRYKMFSNSSEWYSLQAHVYYRTQFEIKRLACYILPDSFKTFWSTVFYVLLKIVAFSWFWYFSVNRIECDECGRHLSKTVSLWFDNNFSAICRWGYAGNESTGRHRARTQQYCHLIGPQGMQIRKPAISLVDDAVHSAIIGLIIDQNEPFAKYIA